MKEKIYKFESVDVLSSFGPKNIVISKKSLYFESVPVLSISCLKNIVISKKIGILFESVSDFCKGSACKDWAMT